MKILSHIQWLARGLAVIAVIAGAGGAVAVHVQPVDSAVLADTGQVGGITQVPPDRAGPHVVVLVVDAARPDEFNLATMPNLARLVANGTNYVRAWVGQLPSITETSHATIGTGVLPYHHGILGDTWRIPGKNQMAPNLLDSRLTRTGYIGSLIRASHVPSLPAIVHAHWPKSIVATASGHKIYAADGLGAGSADFVAFGGLNSASHYVPSSIPGRTPAESILDSAQLNLPSYPRKPGLEDWWATTLSEKFLFKYHPRLLMINLPEVDIAGHASGTDQTVMQPLTANVDVQIGRLVAAYTRAKLIDQTTFIITADHAMVPAVHLVDSQAIESVIKAAGGQPLYVGHGDFSSIWLKDLASVPRVAAALAAANLPGVAAVYARNIKGQYSIVSSPARLADPGVMSAYDDLLASFNNRSAPDIVLLYDENTITMTPTFQRTGRRGDHGGATWGAQHIPLIMAGPDIRPGYTSVYPARMVDIAPTVETLLGIQPQGQDGVPLADAMIHPPAWAVQAQARVAARMTNDVAHLMAEAALRPNTR